MMERWESLQSRIGTGAVLMLVLSAIAGCGEPTAANHGSKPDAPAVSRPSDSRTDDALVGEALDASAAATGEAAVRVLVERTTIEQENPTRAHLRQVFTQSERPDVRIAAIDGIAKGWDYAAMEDLLAALDDPSLEVRQRAGKAVQRMIGLRFPYDASDPPEQRATVVAHMREMWGKLQSSGRLDEWLERLPSVHGSEQRN